jgi:IS605 OrfB family transposase
MILTYKYRIKDRSARKALSRYAFAVNQVWNYCNAYQRDIEARYWAGAPKRKWPLYFDLAALTKGVSKELGIQAQTVQGVCKQFTQSRDKAKHSLRFRASGGARRALGWVPFTNQSYQIEGNSIIYLGKRFRWFGNKRRPLPAIVKGGAFVENAQGHWYVTFQVEVDQLPCGEGEIGIDLGLKTLATCSDGMKIPALRHYRSYQERLAKAQRAKNKRRVKAIHAKIANARRDQLHKASAKLVRENRLIVVGNVNAGKLVKTRMAKSILDAGWTSFRNMLRYKSSRTGAVFIEADERWSSVTCSACAARGGPKGIAGLRMREWVCGDCGAVHDRDVNAARNILAWSAPRLAEDSRRAA